MRQRHGLWVSAVAAAALLACGDSDGSDPFASMGASPAGSAGSTAMAGAGGATPGDSGAGAPSTGSGGADPGTAGGASGGTGGAASGGTGGAASGGTGGGAASGGTGGGAASGGTGGGAQEPVAGTGGAGAGAAGSGGEAGAGDAGSGGSGAAPTMGSCGPETTNSASELGNPDNLGPWTPTHVENTGPNGSSWVYHPEELGQDGLKHPVFQWGPGAGTGPAQYLDHLNLLASHGFVIISQASTQSGRQALDWILEENETEGSMWHQKLDPDRVARGGHSMGALQSFSEADDPRLKLAVLVCGGANGGSGAANMSYPTIFLGGEGEGGTANFAGDYAEVTGLSVFVTHSDTDHIFCARDNLGPWVAFMRWHLCDEEDQWKQEFMAGGTFCSSPWLDCMTKNF